MRLGEDLWREEEKLSQRGSPQRAKHHLSPRVPPDGAGWFTSPRVRLLTPDFCPRQKTQKGFFENQIFYFCNPPKLFEAALMWEVNDK